MLQPARIDEVCDRIEAKLDGQAGDRNRMLDLASALMVVAHELEREVDHSVSRGGVTGKTYLVRTALGEMKQCLHWVEWFETAAPTPELRRRLERALHSARRATRFLEPAHELAYAS